MNNEVIYKVHLHLPFTNVFLLCAVCVQRTHFGLVNQWKLFRKHIAMQQMHSYTGLDLTWIIKILTDKETVINWNLLKYNEKYIRYGVWYVATVDQYIKYYNYKFTSSYFQSVVVLLSLIKIAITNYEPFKQL